MSLSEFLAQEEPVAKKQRTAGEFEPTQDELDPIVERFTTVKKDHENFEPPVHKVVDLDEKNKDFVPRNLMFFRMLNNKKLPILPISLPVETSLRNKIPLSFSWISIPG